MLTLEEVDKYRGFLSIELDIGGEGVSIEESVYHNGYSNQNGWRLL